MLIYAAGKDKFTRGVYHRVGLRVQINADFFYNLAFYQQITVEFTLHSNNCAIFNQCFHERLLSSLLPLRTCPDQKSGSQQFLSEILKTELW